MTKKVEKKAASVAKERIALTLNKVDGEATVTFILPDVPMFGGSMESMNHTITAITNGVNDAIKKELAKKVWEEL